MSTSLYKKDNKGQIRVWTVDSDEDGLVIEHGLLDGEKQLTFEDVHFGKASRDVEEQIESRMESRINRKLDSGYSRDLEWARNNRPVNALGFQKPMLASRAKKLIDVETENRIYQMKLDGHRCLIRNECGEKIAYSRNGKLITSIDHILQDIDVPEGVTLDGELYHHGTPLQRITSWVKRGQSDSMKLKFAVYDTLLPDSPYRERRAFLEALNLGRSSYLLTDNVLETSVIEALRGAIAEGYEGLIFRDLDGRYEDGKRSKGLQKVKPEVCDFLMQDDEFLVKSVIPSKDGWAILVCEIGNNTFRVSCPGSIQEKTFVYRNRIDYVGRYVRVEYATLTLDGKPFHPVAMNWRDKEME